MGRTLLHPGAGVIAPIVNEEERSATWGLMSAAPRSPSASKEAGRKPTRPLFGGIVREIHDRTVPRTISPC
jgi:hypothetical protein